MDKRKILILLWLGGIVIPYNWIIRIAYHLRQSFRWAVGSEPAHVVGHLILFSGLVFLLLHVFQLPQTRRTAILMTLLVLLLGLVQEYFQLQIKARDFGWPEIFDLCVNLTGGFLGWMAYRYFLRYGRYLRIAYFILREV
jgi:glycopeptide antibiotics resistance protein